MDITKNSHKKLLIVKEKILLEEKVKNVKTLSMGDGMKIDHFLLNKKRNIDNFDSSSTKKKTDNRIRVAKMILNKSEMEVLIGDNLKECKCLDYGVEDTKEIISLFNKKESFSKTEQVEV
ncbi:10373_t:CDS:2 [Gigaspora margarita]|uniref:10373_t:CDS:1 n=1 Tax=Gigaspora margarita TaxID=4874 RepID=A0ABN7W726_GIGMA|nr:10373_t:CDS:2 [Gigaspora margarita]